MAAVFQQIPAELGIECVAGDELNVGLAFKTPGSSPTAIDLTNYTFEARVYLPQYANPGGTFTNGGYTVGSTAATLTVSPVSLSGGTVNIGLTELQTASLSPAVGYRWYIRWMDPTGVTLTVLAGTFSARAP